MWAPSQVDKPQDDPRPSKPSKLSATLRPTRLRVNGECQFSETNSANAGEKRKNWAKTVRKELGLRDSGFGILGLNLNLIWTA